MEERRSRTMAHGLRLRRLPAGGAREENRRRRSEDGGMWIRGAG